MLTIDMSRVRFPCSIAPRFATLYAMRLPIRAQSVTNAFVMEKMNEPCRPPKAIDATKEIKVCRWADMPKLALDRQRKHDLGEICIDL